jgi:hypothetical protein
MEVRLMAKKTLSLKEYQKLVLRTAKGKYNNKNDEIANWGLGVAGEAGDLVGCIKKPFTTAMIKNKE